MTTLFRRVLAVAGAALAFGSAAAPALAFPPDTPIVRGHARTSALVPGAAAVPAEDDTPIIKGVGK